MVQISGKYELVSSEKFADYLIKAGMDEELAKKAELAKPIYEVQQQGDKIILKSDKPREMLIELTLNQECDETLYPGMTLKTKAVLEGDTLTLHSKSASSSGRRIHKFKDNEVVIIYQSDDPSFPEASRTFKRI